MTLPGASSLTTGLWGRLEAIAEDNRRYPIRLSVDETEETIRILWEFVGMMGPQSPPDKGSPDDYQSQLLDRARHWAQELQTAMLAAVAYAGEDLLAGVRKGVDSGFDGGHGDSP